MKVQSPEQGDVGHGTKVTEQHASSKPSVADVQTTRVGTDAGAKEPHHPAAAATLKKTPKSPLNDNAQTHVVPSVEPRAEESQPATEPTQQQSLHSNRVLPFPHPRDYGTPLTTGSRRIKIPQSLLDLI